MELPAQVAAARKLLLKAEVAERLHCTQHMVEVLVRRGQLAVVVIGNRYFWTEEGVTAFIEASTRYVGPANEQSVA